MLDQHHFEQVSRGTKMRKIYAPLLFIFILLIAGCSNAGKTSLNSDVVFRSVDEIIEQPLEIANFANDGSATLPIHTTVPVACTLVYGTTPEFGSLTLDQDMAGGTHSDHNPLLQGLAPETKYYFRVQGIDADGVIYISEVMTFETPAVDLSEVENLASPLMGAEIVGFSSAFGGADEGAQWGAASAFDDNPNTEWSSAGDGSDAWVEVKLAQPASVSAVSFQSRAMSNGTAITLAFTITTESGETLGPFEIPDTNQPYEFEMTFEAHTLRFDLLDTTGGNTGVVDIAVFGEYLE
ncbi:MAG: discoidin domain-containing protein [Chloroflexota bacterium]